MLYVEQKRNKYFSLAEKSLAKVLGKKSIEYSKGNGTSDAHWADFTTIMFKPNGGNLHQEGEWVDFPSLVQYYKCCKLLLEEWNNA